MEVNWDKIFSLLLFLRNKDFQEVTLEKDGAVLLQFALAYGFRNIQNLVQKLKRGKSPYHYVEVMACPSGNDHTGIVLPQLTAVSSSMELYPNHDTNRQLLTVWMLWQSCQAASVFQCCLYVCIPA